MRHNSIFIRNLTFLLSCTIIVGCVKKEKLAEVVTGGNTVYTEEQSVSCSGYVKTDGGSAVYTRGICYTKGAGIPTISNQSVSGGSGRGSFSCPITLNAEGLYSYRAFATNSVGIAYGEIRQFTIKPSITIDNFVGTYSFYGYNENTKKYESWDGVNIDTFTGSDNTTWVYVEGLLYNGSRFFVAIGKFDQQNQCIRLFSDLYFSERIFVFGNRGDTLYYSTFNPVALENGNWHFLIGGNGYGGKSEALLKYGDDGVLTLSPSNTPDNYGRYACGYTFKYYRHDDDYYCGNLQIFTNIKLTKIPKSLREETSSFTNRIINIQIKEVDASSSVSTTP